MLESGAFLSGGTVFLQALCPQGTGERCFRWEKSQFLSSSAAHAIDKFTNKSQKTLPSFFSLLA